MEYIKSYYYKVKGFFKRSSILTGGYQPLVSSNAARISELECKVFTESTKFATAIDGYISEGKVTIALKHILDMQQVLKVYNTDGAMDQLLLSSFMDKQQVSAYPDRWSWVINTFILLTK